MERNLRYKLSDLKIRGFKSIAFEPGIDVHFGDINILLGANGAGKSNILGFFKMLGHLMNGLFQRFVAHEGGSVQLLNYGPKVTKTINAQLTFTKVSNPNTVTKYSFELSSTQGDRLIVSQESIDLKNGKEKSKHIDIRGNFEETGLNTPDNQNGTIVKEILSLSKVYQFNDSTPNGDLRQSSAVDSAPYLQVSGNNLAAFLYFLQNHHRESYDRIVEYVRMVVPKFRDFYLIPNGNYVSLNWVDDTLNDYVLKSYQFSDGSIRFIALATLLLQPEKTMPSIILIDEPELGLHPYAIGVLSDMIKDASLHAQIIVSTQSERLVDLFEPEQVYVVERNEDNSSTIVNQCDSITLKEWLKEYSLSELWEKNVIGGRPV